MTADRGPHLDPLGRRLLAAFVLVSVAAVAVMTGAALMGTERGLAAADRQERIRVTDRVAEVAAASYTAAGGWNGADLAPALALAEAAGARLVVRDGTGATVWPARAHRPRGPGDPAAPRDGAGAGAAGKAEGPGTRLPPASVVQAPVSASGTRVGTVSMVYRDSAVTGRGVAWTWIAGAAGVALLVALAAGWFVSRRLTEPLARLAAAAGRFAAGDRSARARVQAPGEIGHVARAFDAMADEVARTESVRRRLAADVAHELRTPLAGLQAGLEELRDGLAVPDPARLASLHDQSLRLGRVVGDLAELAAAESAALSLRLSEVDLADLVRSAVAGQRPTLRAAGLEVAADLDGPVPVRADGDRIHQAVTNLLANAARYCRPGDRVAIRVSRADGHGVVEVADTGPGIARADLPHVFERLWRGGGSGAVAGTGIGLAVVRELVAAHGGTVTVDSAPGSGARFAIRLPLRRGRR